MINKNKLISEFGKNEKDTGNTSVQIAIITNTISDLTKHLKANKKDYATKRSLYRFASKRKSLLTYLKNNDYEEYKKLISKLNIKG